MAPSSQSEDDSLCRPQSPAGASAPLGFPRNDPRRAVALARLRLVQADRDLERRRLAPTERKNAAVAARARTRAAPHGALAKWADAHAGA